MIRYDQPRIQHGLKPSETIYLHTERIDKLWSNMMEIIEKLYSAELDCSERLILDDRLHSMSLYYSQADINSGYVKIPFRFLYENNELPS